MKWILIIMFALVSFGGYYCLHYLTQKLFGLSENKTHLILGSLILLLTMLPRVYIFAAFFVTSLFTPLVLWIALKAGKTIK